jgi:4-amino-4-deoxy-L-arabinose transferase
MGYFNEYQLFTLISGLLLFATSLYFHVREKGSLSLIFLLLSAFSLFCFAALLDPFLNLYDERFHALVAKNLVQHPLKPTLYDDPVVNMAYDTWDKSYIWLHKQPLFLWQIALSFKLFGVSEFTLRLPSVIMGVVLVAIGFRTGKLLVNETTGFLTGVLIISSLYNIQLIAGRRMLEHNDIAFLTYISLSIWSFVEYHYSKKKYWLYMIGLFVGCAVLCKWLVGLLVYSGWFILKMSERKFRPKDFKDLAISLVVAVIVAVPWQVYTMIRYPVETKLEQKYNIQHLFEAIEGHGGSFWYHFEQFNLLYGRFALFLIIPAFIIFYKKIKDRRLFYSIAGMVVITYLFFSLVQTKMAGFTIVTALLIYIPLAAMLAAGIDYLNQRDIPGWLKKATISAAILIIFFARFEIGTILEKHSLKNEENKHSRMLIHNREIFKTLALPQNAVIFNVKGQHYIECMFYTGLPAYRFVPSIEQYLDLKNKGRVVAIFKPGSGNLPDYLINDTSTLILDYKLEGYN